MVVQARFRGPPRSGASGYVSGLLGELLLRAESSGAPLMAAEVRRALELPLTVEREAAGLRVLGEARLMVEARLSTLELDIRAGVKIGVDQLCSITRPRR